VFFSFVCSFKKITHRFARLAIFLCSLPIKDGGDFEKFIKDMKADETDLRLRASHQMGAQINPTPTYCQPLSQSMDGYATARRKHEQRITRLTNPSGSARRSARQHQDSQRQQQQQHPKGGDTGRGSSRGFEPFIQVTSPLNHRTKGDIPEYGNFSGWSKYRQLNASAMLDR
jgi:hypothetical protein